LDADPGDGSQATDRSAVHGTNPVSGRCQLTTIGRSRSMAKTSKTNGFEKLKDPEQYLVAGTGIGRNLCATEQQRAWNRKASLAGDEA
jgi:hypothetical protein